MGYRHDGDKEMSVSEALDMGKYAFYVWASYGLTFGFMMLELIFLMTKKKSLTKSIVRQMRLNRE